MIELTINKEGKGEINQWCAPPTVYLDHWAWRKISESETLSNRFSRALKSQNGTLAFSWLNLVEFTRLTDEKQAHKADVLLDAIWPQVFVLYPNFFKVIEHEDKIQASGERFPPHGDLETLKSILKISPLDPNSLCPLPAPRLFTVASLTRVDFNNSADLVIGWIDARWQEYCKNPQFNLAVNRIPKVKGIELGTRFIARELLGSFIKDRGLQIGKNCRKHAIDVSHAIVAIAYCDYVLLDGHWATQAERARKRISNGDASFNMAKVFSEQANGLEVFLRGLESSSSF